ncbi:MAG: hypothetical protein LH630_08180 [Actinomycetia bacterium]|nr:hypothetical protein [Actinomycetes bacterium]
MSSDEVDPLPLSLEHDASARAATIALIPATIRPDRVRVLTPIIKSPF